MNSACIHTHTQFCDGSDDVETCCRAAYRKGLALIGFSAHAPITRKTGIHNSWCLSDESLPRYIESVNDAKKRWEGKLPVYLGLEVDFLEGLMGPSDRDYLEMSLDYILASVHYVIPPKGKPFTVDASVEVVDKGIKEGYGGDTLGMVEAYLDSEAAMISAGGFDLLAHPDLVKKNNAKDRLFSEEDNFYKKKIAVLASLLAEARIPAEVNTGGLNRGKVKDCYPSLNFLKLLREHDIPMVINADAHKAEDLDGHYAEAKETMLAAGYAETLLFQGRRDGKAVWKGEKL
jgi:histidinol-phosphatase (PHP family)